MQKDNQPPSLYWAVEQQRYYRIYSNFCKKAKATEMLFTIYIKMYIKNTNAEIKQNTFACKNKT